MHKRFQQIGLIGKHGDPMVKETLLRLYDYLISQQMEVVIEEATCRLLEGKPLPGVPEIELPRHSDLVIVVGGDGTLLHAARVLASQNIPLLGINLGRLGFLVDLSPDQMIPRLDEILSGQYEQECRFLLEVSMGDESSPHQNILAFNDVVLHKWNIARMIEFETYVDDQLVNDQRSDGLIVSTPTGSTAYALSGGGPLLYPSLNAIVMVPICPHTLSNRPIVVDGDSEIEIRLNPAHTEDVQITCDGQTTIPAMPGEVIRIRKAEHQVRLIHPKGYDYYSILRAKLGWSENPKKNRC
ncbi:MAG: NAD(+) kinase [Candidatus Thiodiazotropha sp. (ex Lucinoma borealis)]|nr:NAD(+) kinase [Candidatus Thiodiazotropha sp. (ex Lucinoma borealis)]MCU7840641.1 NAD(+) kinase [Candidatus Thiodiazotropha sp. (ex Troendleina suluensis)]MCU7855605.1 NAD(+) kinase [Candidatus Thiodiazotropha sp. (ex Lucinoma borealis)]MCU7864013.1 NAD(+) kinase [Candidatus Thiodiazotropha sp. (ex Lucinoma borealis)]MCU7870092.1 NAD(+) kinase [Candidatus Thiodiazotropha sp. (ex Lucinoma borealis)]